MMQTHKIPWFAMAAILWLWAALATAIHFNEMPALFNLPETMSEARDSYWSGYELYVFIALVLFILYSRPNIKIWFAASGIGVMVLAKIIWLAPLLYFRAHTVWDGNRPFDFLPLLYIATEITKISLLLLTSYWIYKTAYPPVKQGTTTKQGLSIRAIARRHLHHPN